MRTSRVAWIAVVSAVVASCATVQNLPLNQPTADLNAGLPSLGGPPPSSDDDVVVALAFSGGGTRAAAFSFGVLKELAKSDVTLGGQRRPLIDRINFVTGVSGGSITAAYFGLKKSAALNDFRERFLIKNAEESLRTSVNINNLARAFGGGINEDTQFRNWLDANLFEGATFGTLMASGKPRVWINATDIYNRTPFVFSPESFSVICSDFSTYPVSAAVAASSAVPLAFAPVVIETFPERCDADLPDWLKRVRNNPSASPMLQAYARSTSHYRDGSIKYIKLVDGGIVDNFGLTNFTVAREASQTPYGPLSPEHAVKLRRFLFIVVDAGRAPQGDWAKTIEGPSGVELAAAVTDAALDSSVRSSYGAFQATLREWRESLVRWRCSLSAAQVQRLRGTVAGWNCRDVQGFVGRVAFDQLGPARAAQLNAVQTRLKLPEEQVDLLIAAGSDALKSHPVYRDFLRSLGNAAAPSALAAPAPAAVTARAQ